MTQRLIPLLCLFQMLAILWWALPRNFETLEYENDYQHTPIFAWEEPLLNAGKLSPNNPIRLLLNHYINLTGSQQYWDFFAPATPKFHQYLSICYDTVNNPRQGNISCTSPALFTNLNLEFKSVSLFNVTDSRLYRLTENLATLNDPQLFQAFTRYYQNQNITHQGSSPVLVLHLFELAPGFKDLPSYGYQMDKLLFSGAE